MERLNDPQPDDRQLWGRYAAIRHKTELAEVNGGAQACPTPSLLAALIDGRLDKDERTAIGRHVECVRECRSVVEDTGALLAAQRSEPMEAPTAVIARARALGDVPVPVVVGRLDLRRVSRWGLSAAASIAVCVLGYRAGAHSSEAALPGTDLVTELTFGVELDGTTDLDLLLAVEDETEAES